jgi:hypothetical protein
VESSTLECDMVLKGRERCFEGVEDTPLRFETLHVRC